MKLLTLTIRQDGSPVSANSFMFRVKNQSALSAFLGSSLDEFKQVTVQ